MAYITDVKTIPAQELSKLSNLDVLIITSLRKKEHFSHMNCDESVAMINILKPRRAYLTHISHNFGLHQKENARLPDGIQLAYDGLTLRV
jgi:phosphoribosyl 1,2-cyclic phosphate phosphodiesterase